MTMLDRMRRHRNWLKWSLAIVCLAFVAFYIPAFLPTGVGAVPSGAVAVVDGQEIGTGEFQRMYQAQLAQYQQSSGGQVTPQLLKQLGVDRQILQGLVDERAAMSEAERVGITVSDEELAQRIFAIPAFQDKGVFIGTQRYRQLLAAQRPPLSTTEFEAGVRRSLAADKLRQTVTAWLSVSDKELVDEYRRRNDKVKLAVVAFRADSYRLDVNATDAEVAAHFDGHTADFRIPEKRKVKYVLVDVDALRAKITVSQADIERAYNETIAPTASPEQVRASHILLKTEGKDAAAVKATAEDVLKQAKVPGADFGALAKKYSDDASNASKGGDLDFFARGQMVPEFDNAAFALQPGQISELVKTDFGYHIIKLVDRRAPAVKKLEEVKDQLTEQVGFERAQAQATTMSQALVSQIKKPADLDAAARAQGLTVQETGFFARDEPVLGAGSSPEMTAQAFTLAVGEVSGAIRTGRGYVVEAVTEKKDAYVPKLDEVKDRVRNVVINQKALAMSKQKAADVVAKLKAAPDFDKAAKAANLTSTTTDLLTQDGQIVDIGAAGDVVAQALALPVGAVSDPIQTGNGTAIVKVLEKQQTSEADLANAKDGFREQMLADRRSRLFAAYMLKAKQKMKIQINQETLQRVIG
ncbi:MAG: peptidyl-prolyl cis-trans isomerase [Vicinamibacterales bacterium]